MSKNVGLNDIVSKGIADRVLKSLRAMNAVVFSVTIIDSKGIYLHLARYTGGTFYDLDRNQDFTALLDTMGEKIEGMFVEL